MEKEALKELLSQLSLEEKIAQLQQLTGEFYEANEFAKTGPQVDANLSDTEVYEAGSVLGVSGANETKKIQQKYLEKTPHHIPLLFMADVIHGYQTIFPIPLGLGATWNRKIYHEAASVAAKEASVAGVHVTFAPMVDLIRDGRWGRSMESTGEDPYLNSVYAKEYVEGLQGTEEKIPQYKLAACVKHFAAYGAVEAGRDYNTVDLSERQMRETYLPSYVAALEAGAKLVMTSFNTVYGVPSTVNKKLLRNYLRDELNYQGVVISDWGALEETIAHGVSQDKKEAAKKALIASCDIEMMTFCFIKNLKVILEEEPELEELLDEAVLRILNLKNDLGLFEDPYHFASEEDEAKYIGCEDHLVASQQAAEESIVLLKNNESALPLKEKNILFTGALGSDLLGGWSWKGRIEDTPSLEEELKKEYKDANYLSMVAEDASENMRHFVEMATASSTVVAFIGETSREIGEAKSKTNIKLPHYQIELVKKAKELGNKVISVVFAGRGLDITDIKEDSDAILYAFFPGSRGGVALTRILAGAANPSGKLTISLPRTVGQLPLYYNRFNTGRPAKGIPGEEYVSNYMDEKNSPLYSFGYGLSYTNFEYSEVKIQNDELTTGDTLHAEVTVKNTGDVKGKEVVEWYIQDKFGEVVRPLKELKGFEKIELAPAEEKTVTFSISTSELGYIHNDLKKYPDSGEFGLFVGSNLNSLQEKHFLLN